MDATAEEITEYLLQAVKEVEGNDIFKRLYVCMYVYISNSELHPYCI